MIRVVFNHEDFKDFFPKCLYLGMFTFKDLIDFIRRRGIKTTAELKQAVHSAYLKELLSTICR